MLRNFTSVFIVALVALAIPGSSRAEALRGKIRVELSDFAIRIDPPTIKAGQIRFDVGNAPTRLPYPATSDRVDERRLKRLGEVSDLRPGATGHVTLRLKPGRYVFLCNEPGHDKAGMVTVFTVTR